MADDQEDQLKYWQNLRTQAENGELRMDKTVGEALAKRCDTFIGQLNDMVVQATNLQYISGFGGLRSATQLSDKFAKKALGDEDSAVNRLTKAIEITGLMKQTFELSVKQIAETDDQTSSALGNAGPS
ncbi:hypothetical protein [Nocardia sp. NBC_01329]|uniref:hypothetical protein n=1 Tax=Nocardia sp. NBC_01329 TaxID=2903594 RepID=UPI002E161A24|nr:hypothetical protein OG405_02800 [Nocardia sp. NBC_01329]